jgi:hypothetical protein
VIAPGRGFAAVGEGIVVGVVISRPNEKLSV